MGVADVNYEQIDSCMSVRRFPRRAREIKRTGTMANKPTSTGRSVECIDRKEESHSLEILRGNGLLLAR